MINPALQSYLDFLVADRKEHYADVIKRRQYVEGEHTAQLNLDQIALLNRDPKFVLNACEPPLTAKCDRMTVQGFQITDAGNEARGKELSALVRKWWDLSRMDAQSYTLHFSGSRDGDGYLITDYDAEKMRPRFTVNQQYDGSSGVDVAYDSASGGQPIYATKRWTKVDSSDPTKSIRRLNVYYPDKVEKYFTLTTGDYVEAGWQPYTGDGDSGKALWIDPLGNALGLAVMHFANNAQGSNYGRSDIADVVPGLQDVLNLAGVSVIAAAQLAGFPVNYLLGVDDAAATYKTHPGALLVASGAGGASLTAGQFAAANLVQLVDVKNSIIRDIASRTHTPLSYFNTTGQIAGAETLQQQEAPLIAKVKRAIVTYGNGYEDAVRLALKLEAIYGSEVPMTTEEIDRLDIKCLWADPHTKNDAEEAQKYEAWMRLGIDEEIIWSRMGLTEDEIQRNRDLKRQKLQQQQAQTNQLLATLAEKMKDDGEETEQKESQAAPNGNGKPPGGNGLASAVSGLSRG